MKKVLIGVAALLVVILAVVLIAPSFIDWNRYRGDLAEWVRTQTGRQLDIAGGLSLSILPAPTLVASDVTFANDPAGSAEHMVRMQELAVRVAFGPLLGGRIQVESVRLVEPRLVLEMLPDGRGNWTFDRPSEATGGPMPPPPGEAPAGDGAGGAAGDGFAVALEKLTIEDGSIVWRDAAGSETRVEQIAGDIAAESLQGPFSGDLAMTLRGSRVTAELRTGRFAPEAASTPLGLTLGVPDAGGTVTVQGRLAGIGSDHGPMAFTGTLTAESPSLARTLAAVQGVEPAPPLDRAFRLAGTLAAAPDRVALDGMTLRLGETEGSGGASLTLAAPPRLDAALAFTRIDLDTLLREARVEAPVQTAATTPPPAPADISPTQAAAAEPVAPAVPGDPAPPTQALVPALPADLAGSIDVTADVVTWKGGIVRSAAVSASLADGEVTLNEARALLPGSSEINAFGFLDTRAEPAAMDGTVELKSSNLREMLEWLGVDVAAVPADRLRRFAVTAALQGTAADLTLPSLEGVLDLSRFQGAAALRPLAERPAFGLSLSLDALNVDAYLPRDASPPAADPAPAQPEGQSGPTAPAAPPPLLAGLDVLQTFDANVKARAGTLTLRGEDVRDARLDVTLLQGKATFGETVVENLAGSRVAVSGGLSGFGGAPRFDGLTLSLRSDDPAPLARVLDLDLPAAVRQAAPLALSATLTGDLTALQVQTTNRLAGGTMTAEGSVSDVTGTPAVDLTVAANHDDLVGLVRRLGIAYEPQGGKGLGPLALTGRLTGGAQSVTLADLSLRAGPSRLTGEVTVTPGEAVPTVVARLAADTLPVGAFLPAERRAAVERLVGGIVPAAFVLPTVEPAAGLPVTDAQAAAPRWSREPIDLGALDAVTLDLSLTAGQILYDRWRLSDAALTARMADGALAVPELTGALFGGPLRLSATVARTPEGAVRLDLDTALQQMDVGAALDALQGERAARGRMDFRATVATTGASEAALVAGLGGQGALALSKVDMRRVEKAGGSALAALLAPLRALDRLAGVVGGGSYGVDVRGDFAVEQGVVRFTPQSPLTIASNLYSGSLHGAAALPAWTVDAEGEVRLSQNALTALLGNRVKLPEVVPVALSGPLDSPNVKIGAGRGTDASPAPTPDQAVDALKQVLTEELGGQKDEAAPADPAQGDQPAAPKPEKVLRDTLKNLLFQ
ncbi:AsmA family protein [Caenispirillum bisanense]|uniref:AsmA-like C-terminal region n=1 Tax=Caenispirillum bisanense TaxID=414052 RepID=A0A286G6I8_9PROT|nr:AsmA family protein [Caenispirillum bisanense]SOD91167.1 AsmA-like C-terminal region [Caenispirillum bisanense]